MKVYPVSVNILMFNPLVYLAVASVSCSAQSYYPGLCIRNVIGLTSHLNCTLLSVFRRDAAGRAN